MAPAYTASASAGTDSIKGLAQSVAKPAYRRLLVAEPALRRAVPVLIIAFLVTMAIGAAVQINDHRRHAVAGIVRDLEAAADLLAERLERDNTKVTKAELARRTQDALGKLMPSRNSDDVRAVLVTDGDGTVIASSPKTTAMGRQLLDTLGAAQPLTTFAASAGVLEIQLDDGTQVFATVRNLKAPLGQLAIIQPSASALAF